MIVVALLVALVGIAFVIMHVARFLLKSMKAMEDRSSITNNPYINYHKLKDKNDANYDQYLNWLEKNGSGVPVEQVKAPEDVIAENKIKRLF